MTHAASPTPFTLPFRPIRLPRRLALFTDTESAALLAEHFDALGYGWRNAVGVLTADIFDSGRGVADLAQTARRATIVLNNCWSMIGCEGARSVFERWYATAIVREQTRREQPDKSRPPTHVAYWDSALAGWLMNDQRDVSEGFDFANRLVRIGLTPPAASTVCYHFRNTLEPEQQRQAFAIVMNGGFSAKELTNIEVLKSYFARKDWAVVFACWQRRGRQESPFIRDFARRRDRANRPAATVPIVATRAVFTPTVVNAEPVREEKRQRDPLTILLTGGLPKTLRKEIPNLVEAVRVLLADRLGSIEVPALAQAATSRRKKAANQGLRPDVLLQAVPHLVSMNLITCTNGRLRAHPTACV